MSLAPGTRLGPYEIAAQKSTDTNLGRPVAILNHPNIATIHGADIGQSPQYDVARDGRFLITMELDSATAPITLLQNWNPDAKQ